jgi:hypothetical protein
MMTVQNPPNTHEASPVVQADARLRELEAENARLRSLIGELLVTNQQLRERSQRQ